MWGGNAPVVPAAPNSPLPGSKEPQLAPLEDDPSLTVVQYTRSTVTITFDERIQALSTRQNSDGRESARHFEESKAKMEDLYVRRHHCCYSTFARHSAGGAVDLDTEWRFARSRYVHFRTAFMHVSFLMPLGVLCLAFRAVAQRHWRRVAVLVGAVAPLYLLYGIFAKRRKQQYLEMSGTIRERVLVGLLCVQSLCIACAEWARPEPDYGMLVMHIGFVHNFTPLGAGAMQVVTAVFGLFPYSLLTLLRLLGSPAASIAAAGPASMAGSAQGDEPSGRRCAATTGEAAVLVRLVVPCVILLYQGIVTMRRDESLRFDRLHQENLGMQQKLFAIEKQRNEGILMSMLPRRIIKALKANEPVEPQHFDDVTVIFVEICEFSRLCVVLEPAKVVEMLNIVYHEFDRLSDLLHVYKVETVGQVYMAVVGCPEPVTNHADVAAHFALSAQRSMLSLRTAIGNSLTQPCSRQNSERPAKMTPVSMQGSEGSEAATKSTTDVELRVPAILDKEDLPDFAIRVGLNSGPIRAGIVGIDSPRYKLFGDTVNTASRMESTCEPGKVQVSPSTRQRLTESLFELEDRGEIAVKGKGMMNTAYVHDRSGQQMDGVRKVVIERRVFIPESEAEKYGLATPLFPRAHTWSNTSGLDDEFKSVYAADNSGWSSGGSGEASCRGDSNAALVTAALGRELGPASRAAAPGGAVQGGSSIMKVLGYLDRLQLVFLLPAAQKNHERLRELRLDIPTYNQCTIQKRILFARTLMIFWLLILTVLFAMDYFMDVLHEDLATYRTAIVIRAAGNHIVGLVYMLLLNLPASHRFAQQLTVAMLAIQGVALLACGAVLYNSEPAIIALYGAYIHFYTVCTIPQRLALCTCAVTAYVVIEYVRCDSAGVQGAAENIGFLVVFLMSMVCGVRLEEHLQHVAHYEQRGAAQRLEEIRLAKAAGSQLLNNLLPPHVVELVGEGVSPIAEHHSDVTIIFTDIKGFTAYSSRISPHKLVTVLNSMYSAFDEIISNWALHKVEIIGDAYFVSAGCPAATSGSAGNAADPSEYAMRAVEVALALLRTLPSVCDDTSVQMRVGLHTGSVVAGVVGKKGPRYHLFGAAVGYAEKMESHGIPGRVQVSDATHSLLEEGDHAYEFEERTIEVEGEEEPQRTWLVTRSNSKAAFQIQKKLMALRRNQQR